MSTRVKMKASRKDVGSYSSSSSDCESDDGETDLTRLTYEILEKITLKSINPSQHSGQDSSHVNPSRHKGHGERPDTQNSAHGEKKEEEMFQSIPSHKSRVRNHDNESSVGRNHDNESSVVRNHDNGSSVVRNHDNRVRLDSASPDGATAAPGDGPTKNRRNLYICNLDPAVTEVELRDHFTWYGTILSTHIMRKRGPGGVGCAFVRYASHEQARRALDAMNNAKMRGRTLRVDFAFTEKPPRTAEQRQVGQVAQSSGTRVSSVSAGPSRFASREEKKLDMQSLPVSGRSWGNTGETAEESWQTPSRARRRSSNSFSSERDDRNAADGERRTRERRVTFADYQDGEEEGGRGDDGGVDDEGSENQEEDVCTEDDYQSCEEKETEQFDGTREDTIKSGKDRADKNRESNQPTSIKEHIENILVHIEEEISGVFDVDKMAVVRRLKVELEEELLETFDEGDVCKMIEHGLNQIEEVIGSLVVNIVDATIWEQLETLKNNIEECFEGPNKVNEQKKRENVAKIMTGIVELERNLREFEEEGNKKASLVAGLIVIGENIDKFVSPDDSGNVQIAQLAARVLEIHNAKTLFLTDELKRKRQSNLDRIRERIKKLNDKEFNNSVQNVKKSFADLKESVKAGYLQDSKPSKSAVKRFRNNLTKMRATLSDVEKDKSARTAIVDGLNEIREEIHGTNLTGIRTFIQSQKDTLGDRLDAEKDAQKRDSLTEDYAGDFWTHMEEFLVESCNGSDESQPRDNAINLYVNNLHRSVDSFKLRREFREFGDIVSTRVFSAKSPTHRWSPGRESSVKTYGFVRFRNPEDAVRAMEKMNGVRLIGRVIEVSVASGEENIRSYWRYLLGKAMQ